MPTLDGYASLTSAEPGESIGFSISCSNLFASVRIDFHRKGKSEELVLQSPNLPPGNHPIPPNEPWRLGYNWPVAYTLVVPSTWRPGVYVGRLVQSGSPSLDILFVVRSSHLNVTRRILLQIPVTTAQAYNNAGGKSLYASSSSGGVAATTVSFDRPLPLDSFTRWELPFIQWLESNAIEADYCTSIDLHSSALPLEEYDLLVCVGHDEYWTKEMRDNVEAFVGNGGNVAFFTGNTCWWQMRFEGGNRQMTVYRVAANDPLYNVDNTRVTVEWYNAPVNRPEDKLTGISFRRGAGYWGAPPKPHAGYSVLEPQHWIYAGTGLQLNSTFGGGNDPSQDLVGYETDASYFLDNANPRTVAGDPTGAPTGFIVLARADLLDWGSDPNSGQSGRATMGLFHNSGTVFNAATTNWSKGLSQGAPGPVDRITRNALQRLSQRAGSVRVLNAGFERWAAATTPDSWVLEGSGNLSKEVSLVHSGLAALRVDATIGQTWLSQNLRAEAYTVLRASCWARSGAPGATIRLQSTTTWLNFAEVSHSGDGTWQHISAIGAVPNEGGAPAFRVKIQVAAGVVAYFDEVRIDAV